MLDYDETILVLKNYVYELREGYIKAKQSDIQNYDTHFVVNVISVLHKYKQYLLLLSKIHIHDLLDALEAHKERYIKSMINRDMQEHIDQYKTNIAEISEFLMHNIKSSNESLDNLNDDQEISLLRIRMFKITNNITSLMGQKNHNILANDYVQACAIAYNINSLDLGEQEELVEKMILFREIWSITNEQEAKFDSIKYKFQHDVTSLIDKKLKNSIEVTSHIIDLLLYKYNILPTLLDQQIISLYNHLKNHELNCTHIVTLLDKVHEEARIRYSYNRLSETEYELVNLFQNFDTLLFHQEKLKFGVIKAYLLDRENFLKHLSSLLLEQVDNIRAFSLNNDENLLLIIKKISSSFSKEEIIDKVSFDTFNYLKKILPSTLDINVQKKYSNLDKYTVTTLVEKYKNLFTQIAYLLNNDDLSKLFLKQGLIEIINKEFHLPNLSNSVEKIRLSALENIKIEQELNSLNLEEIFIHPGIINKVSDLDFKKILINLQIRTSDDYIKEVIKKLISQSSASQLNILFHSSSESANNHLHLFIQQEIKQEVYKRTSFVKMISAILTGNRNEHEQLKNLKNII